MRVPELDGLRGVAILAVLCAHCGLLPGGFLGIDIFFTLSGFLITGILHREYRNLGEIRLGQFYRRRALRLFPALYAYLLACAVWSQFDASLFSIPIWQAFGSAALYVSNWVSIYAPTINGVTPLGPLDHTWSLSIEEQFYLTWPIAFLALSQLNLKRRTIAFVLLSLVCGSVYLRMSGDRGTLAHADGLLIGCACALLKTDAYPLSESARRRLARLVSGLCWLLVFILMTVPQANTFSYRITILIASISTGLLLLALSLGQMPALRAMLSSRTLVYLGQRSYSLYLWHFPFSKYLLTRPSSFPFAINVAMTLCASFLLAEFSYQFIEQPFLRRKIKSETTVADRSASPVTPFG